MRKKVLRKLSFGCACFGVMFLSLFPVHAEAEDTYMKSILTELTTSPRAMGTPEIDKALEYLEAELASMEYDIEKQTFYYDEELNASSVQNRGNLSGYLSGAFTNSSEGIPGINLIAEKKSPDVKKTLISLLDIPAVTITQDLSEELHINSENDKLDYIDYARLIEISDCVNNAIKTLSESF